MIQIVCTIGQIGDGKSSLLNNLIGKDIFESTDSADPVTQNIQHHTISYGDKSIVLVDTPGLNTSEDTRLLNMIVNHWPNRMRIVHWFILVFNATNTRASSSLMDLLRLYKSLCNDLFSNCVVVFKHCKSPNENKRNQFRNFLQKIWEGLEIPFPEAGVPQFFIDSSKTTSPSVQDELLNLKTILSKTKNPVRLSTSRLLSTKDQNHLEMLRETVKNYVTSLDVTQTTLKADILEICKNVEDKFLVLETKYIKFLKENLENKLPNKICGSIAKIVLEYLDKSKIDTPTLTEIGHHVEKTMKETEINCSLKPDKIGVTTTGILGVLGMGSIVSVLGGATGATTGGTGSIRIVLACIAIVGGIVTASYLTQGWNREEVKQNLTQQLLDNLIKENYPKHLQDLAENTWVDIKTGKTII